jgi:hypothetical protein
VGDAEPRVRLFDSLGSQLQAFGTNGSGPGELKRPTSAFVLSDRGIRILDAGNARLVAFVAPGKPTEHRPVPGVPVALLPSRSSQAVLTSDHAMATQIAYLPPSEQLAIPLADSGSGSTPLDWRANSATFSLDGTTLYFASGYRTYRILRRTANGAVSVFAERGGPPPQMSDDEHEALTSKMRRVMADVAARMNRPARPLPPIPRDKLYIAQDGLRVDGLGRLWVLTGRGGSDFSIFDVFRPDGVSLGEVRLPSPATSFGISGPWLAVAGANADGVVSATLFRLQ